MATKPITRLSEIDVEAVALVDRAANKRRFLIVKRDTEEDTMGNEVTTTGEGTGTSTTAAPAAKVADPIQAALDYLKTLEGDALVAATNALVAAANEKVAADTTDSEKAACEPEKAAADPDPNAAPAAPDPAVKADDVAAAKAEAEAAKIAAETAKAEATAAKAETAKIAKRMDALERTGAQSGAISSDVSKREGDPDNLFGSLDGLFRPSH